MRMRVLIALVVLMALTGALLLCDSFRVTQVQATTHTTHHAYHQQNALALPPSTAVIMPLLLLLAVVLWAAAYRSYPTVSMTCARNARISRARDTLTTWNNFLVHYFRTGILNPKLYSVLA